MDYMRAIVEEATGRPMAPLRRVLMHDRTADEIRRDNVLLGRVAAVRQSHPYYERMFQERFAAAERAPWDQFSLVNNARECLAPDVELKASEPRMMVFVRRCRTIQTNPDRRHFMLLPELFKLYEPRWPTIVLRATDNGLVFVRIERHAGDRNTRFVVDARGNTVVVRDADDAKFFIEAKLTDDRIAGVTGDAVGVLADQDLEYEDELYERGAVCRYVIHRCGRLFKSVAVRAFGLGRWLFG